MNRRTPIFKWILLVTLLISLIGTANANEEINSCRTLSTVGETYVLNQSFNATSATCLTVGASDIVVDGSGNTIGYANTSVGHGIVASGRNNITIKNIKIFQINTTLSGSTSNMLGVNFFKTNNSLVMNNSITSYNSSAMYIESTENNTVNSSIISSNRSTAVYVKNTANVSINSNRIFANNSVVNSNNIGIFLTGSSNNSISNNTVNTALGYGIELSTSTYNTLSLNTVNTNGNNGIALVTSSHRNNLTSNYVRTLDGNHAISISTSNNVTLIQNFGVSDTENGIILVTSPNATLRYNTAMSNTSFGMNTTTWGGVFDSNVFISNYDYGIYINYPTAGYNNTFTNTTVISPYANTAGTHRILSMGDSITYGTGGTIVPGGYDRFLNASLQTVATGWHVSNRGWGGETSENGSRRLLTELEIYNPVIILIMYGINDQDKGFPQAAIIKNITDMANLSTARGIKVYILTTTNQSGNSGLTKALDINLTAQATALGFTVVNTYDAVDSVPNNGLYDTFYNYTVDGTHFNDVGYELLGNKIYETIYNDYILPYLPQSSCAPVASEINTAFILIGTFGIVISSAFIILGLKSFSFAMMINGVILIFISGVLTYVGFFVVISVTGTTC